MREYFHGRQKKYLNSVKIEIGTKKFVNKTNKETYSFSRGKKGNRYDPEICLDHIKICIETITSTV